jgi:hypothetical protein
VSLLQKKKLEVATKEEFFLRAQQLISWYWRKIPGAKFKGA